MGCVRSKEAKGPALKYQPDNSNVVPVSAHLGHYGPEPTIMGQSPAMKTQNNSHPAALSPFGGVSSAMTPFGGASTSFTSVTVNNPFPAVITGPISKGAPQSVLFWGNIIILSLFVISSPTPAGFYPLGIEDFYSALFQHFLLLSIHLKQLQLNICYSQGVRQSRSYAN